MSAMVLSCVFAQDYPRPESFLPPPPPWSGVTRSLIVAADDPWITPAERSGLRDSPSYAETIAWLEKLVAAAPELTMFSIGKSRQGRDIMMVIASKAGRFTPEALRGKPVLLAHGGIHSGEIDGKDAGLMLLRDMTVAGKKKELLDGANFLFIPILSVDAHERASAYNRINQRGPRTMGWRTNARNLNLNRDYTKLETPELQSLVAVLNRWRPDLYVDIHVTDGIDYQYDITFGFNGVFGYSPASAGWLTQTMTPAVNQALTEMGHVPGPLIFAVDNSDMSKGIVDFTASPRFSNGYGDARHLPSVLVENHSLKPYDQRVLGTYVFLDATLRVLAENGNRLRAAIEKDRQRRPERVVLSWKPAQTPPEMIDFLGVASEKTDSELSGGEWVHWLGKPQTLRLPQIRINEPAVTAVRPKAYWVPATWPEIIEKLGMHGVVMERIDTGLELEVEMIRVRNPKLDKTPFEGRVRVTAELEPEKRREWFPPGSVRISTDQPLSELIALLLEPASGDSFFQWGYFHEILQQTEYFESYAMEPLARAMLAGNPELKKEFEARLKKDEAFAKDPRARLHWFYERSPYMDDRWLLYPVAREL